MYMRSVVGREVKPYHMLGTRSIAQSRWHLSPILYRSLSTTTTTATTKNDKKDKQAKKDKDKDREKEFSATLHLPITTLPLRPDLSSFDSSVHSLLYRAQESEEGRAGRFVLHDGPPYANGPLHIGHALNKLLKDFTLRYKLLRGYQVNFVPGWDCHGLPIEQKVPARANSTPLAIRQQAAAFADTAIANQSAGFQSWGVIGDWDKPYTTKAREYEASQLGLFLQLYNKGFVYRGVKPVMWSPSSRTALAEAEIEYEEKHVSKALYVTFPVDKIQESQLDKLRELQTKGTVEAVIWTTTPWTLPANMAISVHPDLTYAVVDVTDAADTKPRYLIIVQDRLEAMRALLGRDLPVAYSFAGSALKGSTYTHPLDGRSLPFLLGTHVITTTGSGLVHTAPAHGLDDFQVCQANNIAVSVSMVDDHGNFTAELPASLSHLTGQSVLAEGNEGVITALQNLTTEHQRIGGAVLAAERYVHKYPYDWRTKKPVIMRATEQWFIGLNDLVDPAVRSLDSINMVPPQSKARLEAFLKGRQEWCISRQRVWGVPIPAFYHKDTGKPLISTETVAHVQKLVYEQGSDCWFALPVEQLLPPSMQHEADQYRKGMDTMDVWLDSGSSWNHVLKESDRGYPADVYLEGSDQHRGWFQSSLLTSIASTGQAPYRTLITNGFVLDADGRKMSKSLGNVVDPTIVIKGDPKSRDYKEPCGVDGLRLWAATSDYTRDCTIGPNVLAATKESLRRLRNTSRFLLGNLHDFDPREDTVPYSKLPQIDKYMLHRLHQLGEIATEDYDQFMFFKVTRALMNFATMDLSAFYFEATKDRLYAEGKQSHKRRSCQTVLHRTFDTYSKLLAPIACHLAEELHAHSPKALYSLNPLNYSTTPNLSSFFQRGWITTEPEWNQPELAQQWELIKSARTEVYKVLEQARQQKLVNSFLEASVAIQLPKSKISDALMSLHEDDHENTLDGQPSALAEVLLTSHASINAASNHNESTGVKATVQIGAELSSTNADVEVHRITSSHKCPRCWRYTSAAADVLCLRCAAVLATTHT